MSYNNIESNFSSGIATITINRPNKLNALNRDTIQELHEAFDEANNDKDTKVIIITGSGEKAFVAGADISEFADFNVDDGGNLAAQGQKILFDFVSGYYEDLNYLIDVLKVNFKLSLEATRLVLEIVDQSKQDQKVLTNIIKRWRMCECIQD